MDILVLILTVPFVFGVIMFFMPLQFKLLQNLHIFLSVIVSSLLLSAVGKVVNEEALSTFHHYIFLDALGAIFLSLIAITGLLANVYATTYMKWELEEGHVDIKEIKNYFALSFIFTGTMSLSVLCNNIAFMWAAIEATTLASVFLVAVKKDKKSTESGYKYIVLCSIGLAFALYATILLFSAANGKIDGEAMLYTNLLANADRIDSMALKLVFIFALIGFGTKAGLAPTHTWLPDVHAEGPAPTSALLSGVLLKCAMLGLIRYYAIVANGVGFDFVQTVMIVSATLTLFISAFFLIRQHNVKRMFAYHSVAHMGVIAFGLGVGGAIGLFAALFHCVAHSFTKALAFCSTGNIARIYGTKDMTKMGGMIRIAPLTAVLFGIAICSLVGVPGFAIFVSEFLIFKAAALDGKYLLMGIFAIALAIIFIADFSHFFLATFGKVEGNVVHNSEMKLSENLPLVALAILIVTFGVWQFDSFTFLLDESVKSIMKQ